MNVELGGASFRDTHLYEMLFSPFSVLGDFKNARTLLVIEKEKYISVQESLQFSELQYIVENV